MFVSCDSGCPNGGWCGVGIGWDEDAFRAEFGRVPVSVDEARELVARERCDVCGTPHIVWHFAAWEDYDGEDPIYLVEFDLEGMPSPPQPAPGSTQADWQAWAADMQRRFPLRDPAGGPT